MDTSEQSSWFIATQRQGIGYTVELRSWFW